MEIKRIDHLVLTVADMEKTIRFYTEVMGLKLLTFGKGRKALAFGKQKINLHQKARNLSPKLSILRVVPPICVSLRKPMSGTF